MRWEDFKRRAKNVWGEFKSQKMGMVGLGIIIFLAILAIFAPVIAPNVSSGWRTTGRWRDNPNSAAPVWMNYISGTSRAEHYETDDFQLRETGDLIEVVYDYNHTDDLPPQQIIVYIRGQYTGDDPYVVADFERPDGEVLTLKTTEIDGSQEEGIFVFNERLTFLTGSAQRERIHRWASFYETESIDYDEISPEETMFGKLDENVLSNPNNLEGDYTLRLRIDADDIDIAHSRAIFTGQVYGSMGTDDSGRDIGLGWVWGARYGLILGLAVAGLSVLIALTYGMTSAYYGGWTDEIMQRFNEIFMGIPVFPVLVLVLMLWGRNYSYIILLLAIFYWRGIAKNIRARGLQIRQNTYVEASQAIGASGGRIVRTHMMPQMLPYALAEGALMVPMAIITAAGLHVLGLGDPTLVTWGTMLSEANAAGATITGLWWWVLLPGLGITLVGFGFICLGMAIERIVNPKMKQG